METRLQAMPDQLAKTGADIIVLEEVWSARSKEVLIQKMRDRGYAYAAYTKASHWFFIFQTAMGDGLLVLSKYPISDHVIHHDFTEATQYSESYTSKGVMKLIVKHPFHGWMDVYAAHLGAVDFENGDYKPDQAKIHSAQITELADFIKSTRSHPLTILAADLNMHYQQWSHDGAKPHFEGKFSTNYSKLVKSSCGYGNQLVDSYPFDQKNPYVSHGYFDSLPSEVEDYVFLCENPVLHATSSSLEFKNAHLSDHYGVLTSFSTHEEAREIRVADFR
jgi:endonuclease/exonuclease/phosphatase family metal-dependent hydrolase